MDQEKAVTKDRLFIQEIINDLEKNGYVRYGKAREMLFDWSRELRDAAELKGKTRRAYRNVHGKQPY